MGYLTVNEGERWLVTKKNGKHRFVDGPKRIFLFREKKEWCRLYTCSEVEYLKITYKNGQTKHVRGPTSRFFDPIAMVSIDRRPVHLLSASEQIVVYRNKENDKGALMVERHRVVGPAVYMIAVNEWVHQFSWHGKVDGSKVSYQPDTRKFKKLSTTPESMYYNVRDVRTNDDATLSIKLMLFYHMKDAERMLDTTQDPIGEFLNSVCADVIAFASTRDYETLLAESNMLNNLANYGQLCQRAGEIGMVITKVVFRGHHSSQAIEQAQIEATTRRTQMRVEADIAREEQVKIDMQLQAQVQRERGEREMQLRQQEHEEAMRLKQAAADVREQELAHDALLSKRLKDSEFERDAEAAKRDAAFQHEKRMLDQKLNLYGKLYGMGVDLTRYLCAEHERADKHVHITGAEAQASKPVVHLEI